MKISNELAEELVKQLVGSKAIPLVRLIKEKDNIGEFKLAEKLKLTVNQIRTLLYDLSSHSLVSFTRKKDKKKGWYNYFWSFKNRRAVELLLVIKKEMLEALKKRLNVESTDAFFKCPSGCVRMTLESAMEVRFKCMECGNLLQEQKTYVNIENTNKEISKIEQDIAELEKLSAVEEEKVKKKVRKIKKRSKKKVRGAGAKKGHKIKKKKVKNPKKVKKRVEKKQVKPKKIKKFSLKKLKKIFKK